jgi:hypothetical protein
MMANILRCSRSCQRLVVHCLLAAALVAAIICFGSTWPPAANAEGPKNGELFRERPRDVQERLAKVVSVPAEKTSVVEDAVQLKNQEDSKPPPRATKSEKAATTVPGQQWAKAMGQIEALLDDEYRLKALLAPITETGEPLLRDLTHRIRAFRDVFRSWEELHVDSEDGGSTHQYSALGFYADMHRRSQSTVGHPPTSFHETTI